MSEPTILIVDDEPANVFLLESVIKPVEPLPDARHD